MNQEPVNIIYPINGATLPRVSPASQAQSAYFAASFSVTHDGGPWTVAWSVDGEALGTAKFYDQFTAQFTSKLGAGAHTLRVESPAGVKQVTFTIA
jgi:hypothetical protein